MSRYKKTIEQYEAEAQRVKSCLVHPVRGAARKVYVLRHGIIKTGLRVRHTCGNDHCILDKHLKTEPAKKSVKDYEREAVKVGKCLIHPTCIARIMYQLRHGKLSSSKIYVCHTCDNPQCIRDSHHFLGSHNDNMKDAKMKGRMKHSEATKALLRAVKSTDAARKRASDSALRCWEPAAVHKRASKTQRSIWRRSERRKQRSIQTSAYYESAEARKLTSDAALVRWSRSEERLRASDTQTRLWSSKARRKKASESANRKWENAAEHEKSSAAAVLAWKERKKKYGKSGKRLKGGGE
jgi:hypothetical protein